jgi:small subunit ribosomal protein S1
MGELLEESSPLRELRRGDVVDGQIMRMDQDGILVSVGHKSEGVVPIREMRSLASRSEAAARYQVGETIQVYVLDTAGDEDQAILSIDRARGEAAWLVLEKLVETGETIQGRITGHNRGGAVVDVDGVQGFVPLSQAVLPPGENHEEAITSRIGEEVKLKVLEVNRRRNRAVLSERAAARERRDDLKDKLLDTLEEGTTRAGRVTGISSFGAFVDIGGADGLVHVSELSWAPVASVEDVVHVGQELEVYILRVDRETKRIARSIRRLQATPWENAASRFEIGQLVTGTVTKLTDFGAFARVDDIVEGLIHVSELTERHIRHPKDVVDVGDTMTLRVVSLDPERHRLGLSLKQIEEDAPTEYRDAPEEPAGQGSEVEESEPVEETVAPETDDTTSEKDETEEPADP